MHTFVAIELDMLKGKKLAERLTLKAGAAEEVTEAGGPVTSRLTIEDRSLKASCQNVVVLSVLMLQEEDTIVWFSALWIRCWK